MLKFTLNSVIIGWLLIITSTQTYLIKAHKELLKFEDTIVNDNIKNVVKYDSRTFLLYGLQGQGYVEPKKYFQKYPVYGPVYIEDVTYEDLANEARLQALGEGD